MMAVCGEEEAAACQAQRCDENMAMSDSPCLLNEHGGLNMKNAAGDSHGSSSPASDFIPNGFKSLSKKFSLPKLTSVGRLSFPLNGKNGERPVDKSGTGAIHPHTREVAELKDKIRELEDKLKFESLVVRRSMDGLCRANEELENELAHYRTSGRKELDSGKDGALELQELRDMLTARDAQLKESRQQAEMLEEEKVAADMKSTILAKKNVHQQNEHEALVKLLKKEWESERLKAEEERNDLQNKNQSLKAELVQKNTMLNELKEFKDEKLNLYSEAQVNLREMQELKNQEIADLRQKLETAKWEADKHILKASSQASTVEKLNEENQLLKGELKRTQSTIDSHRKSLNECIVEKEESLNKHIAEVSVLKTTHESEVAMMCEKHTKEKELFAKEKCKLEKELAHATEVSRQLEEDLCLKTRSLESSMSAHNALENQLESFHKQKEDDKGHSEEKIKSLSDQLSKAEMGICEKEELVRELKSELGQLHSCVETAEGNLNDAKLAMLIKERKGTELIKDFKRQLKLNCVEIEKLEGKLHASQTECVNLRERLHSLSMEQERSETCPQSNKIIAPAQNQSSPVDATSDIDTETLLNENALLIEKMSTLQCKAWTLEEQVGETQRLYEMSCEEVKRKDEVILSLLGKIPTNPVPGEDLPHRDWKVSPKSINEVLEKSLVSLLGPNNGFAKAEAIKRLQKTLETTLIENLHLQVIKGYREYI
eukprot:Nk52_evm30s208 gene=Nk52_evmTU30s208